MDDGRDRVRFSARPQFSLFTNDSKLPWDPLGLLPNGYRGHSNLGVELTTYNSLVPLVKKDEACSCT